MEIPDFITHYHYPDKKPFLNLSDLKEEERTPIVKELNSRLERGETKRGFPDWYFVQRKKAEIKMKQLYIEKGGKPERDAPHYFVLGRSLRIEEIYNNNFKALVLTIPKDDTNILYSIGDSLWTFARSEDPDQQWENQWFQGSLYNYQEVVAILKELKINLYKPETMEGKRIGFVEALIWSDKVLQELIENNSAKMTF